MSVKKESEKSGLQLNIPKNQDPGIQTHHSMANRRGKSGNSDRFHFLALQNHYSRWLQPINLNTLISWKGSHDKPQFNSVQFSHSVMSDSFQPHGLQHARPPCPSPTPRVYSNSCPLSWWCHPTISSSVIPFSSRLQSFPASGSFQISQLFASGDQVLELELQHQSFQWVFRTDFLSNGLVGSPFSPRDSQESSPTPQFKSISSLVLSFLVVNIHSTHGRNNICFFVHLFNEKFTK